MTTIPDPPSNPPVSIQLGMEEMSSLVEILEAKAEGAEKRLVDAQRAFDEAHNSLTQAQTAQQEAQYNLGVVRGQHEQLGAGGAITLWLG